MLTKRRSTRQPVERIDAESGDMQCIYWKGDALVQYILRLLEEMKDIGV